MEEQEQEQVEREEEEQQHQQEQHKNHYKRIVKIGNQASSFRYTGTHCLYAGCSRYNFRCAMGLCLRYDVYCNGTVECPDGSDEPPNCQSEFMYAILYYV